MDNHLDSSICPYLGRYDDPDSYYAFGTDGNCCYAEQRPAPIVISFQAAACLGEEWPACPRYKTATSHGPAEAPPARPRRKIASGSSRLPRILFAAVAAAVLLLAWLLVLRPSSTGDEPLPATLTLIAAGSQTPSQTPSTTTLPPGLTRVTDSVIAPTLTSPKPSATPAFTASPPSAETPIATSTLTARPSVTPTRTPTSTPSRLPTAASSPTATPSRLPTAASSPTATPPAPSPAPTTPAPTSTLLPAPTLLAPSDKQDFTQDAEVVLVWQSADELPADAYYAISVAYLHDGETWYDEVPWTQDTSWTLSEHHYLLDLSDDGQFWWSVQVVRQIGVDAGGKPTGLPLSGPSNVRTLVWRRASGGGGETPQLPPP